MSYTHAYVGVAPCGCIRAATVDDDVHPKDVAADIVGFMRGGMTLERVSLEGGPVRLCWAEHAPGSLGCPHDGACPERTKEATAA